MRKELIHIQLLFKRLAIVLLLFTLCRLLFYVFNYHLFPSITSDEFFWIAIYGLRYDISAIIIINFLFILMHIIPNPWRERKFYQNIMKGLFYFINGVFLVLEAGDFIYYEFAQERTSSHIFGLNNDILGLIPQFIKDFWYILIICCFVLAGIEWLYRKTHAKVKFKLKKINYRTQVVLAIVLLHVFFIASRGGVKNSLAPQSAAEVVEPSEISLVTNTTFTLIHSVLNRELLEPKFFNKEELDKEFPIYHQLEPKKNYAWQELGLEQKPNVVVLIMESFSKEYVGYFNNGKGYTPFLDELIEESYVFENAYANGKHSIDGIPSVALGLPALMTDAFISSQYIQNDFEGMGKLAHKSGYKSMFFHGGTNGTLNFDLFASRAGFEYYFGRNEYGNDKDFDGNWGIFDGPFLQFTANKLNESNEPFCALFFALSSHHPFTLPAEYQGKYKKGELPIHEVVQYSDDALKAFFATASTMEWFDNTIFIITSDHTGPIFQNNYKNRLGHYSIPIVVYAPGTGKKGKIEYTAQQTDILPTVLELMQYNGNYTSFGTSLFDDESFKFSVNSMNNIYQLISGDYVLHFDGQKTIGIYNKKKDPMLRQNLIQENLPIQELLTKKVKAIIQAHRYSLIHNQLVAK